MADNNEEVLRRSLDAVDRHRNRLLIGFVAATLVGLGIVIQITVMTKRIPRAIEPASRK